MTGTPDPHHAADALARRAPTDASARRARTDTPTASGPADASAGPARTDASARRAPTDAPWVRTHLRAAPGPACGLALLVLVLAFLAAAAPRALDRYGDTALHRELAARGPALRSIDAAFAPGARDGLDNAAVGRAVAPERLAAVERTLRGAVTPPLRIDPAAASYGVGTEGELALTDPGLPRIDGPAPQISLYWQQDEARHVRLVAGRRPTGAPQIGGGSATVEIMVGRASAALLRVKPGSVLHMASSEGLPFRLRVSGVYEPVSAADPYWAFQQSLVAPRRAATPPPGSNQYWKVAALVDDASVAALPRTGPLAAYWHHPLPPDALAAHRTGAALRRLGELTTDAAGARLGAAAGLPGDLALTSPLTSVLDGFQQDRAAIAPLLTVAAAGLAGVAGAVLLMAAGLVADGRAAELALLRARGAGLPSLAGRLAAETAAVAAPAAAAGWTVALLLLPTARWGAAAAAAGMVAAAVVLVVPLRAVLGHRGTGAGATRRDVARARPSRRRTVAELAVLVATAGAVAAVRRRGVVVTGGVDPLVSATPFLLGLAGAVVLLRLYPWPLRMVARLSAARRGAVPFLGLTRAARTSASGALLPLLALLLALTVAVFGGTVVAGVSDGRARAALAQVGADARVESSVPLSPALLSAAPRLPGVRTALPVRTRAELSMPLELGTVSSDFTLVVADAAAYARLSGAVGIGGFDAGLLAPGRADGVVPALASPALAGQLGRGVRGPLDTGYGDLRIRVAGIVRETPAVRGREFLVVPLAAVRQQWTRHSAAPLGDPDMLLFSGPVDAAALHRAVAGTASAEAATVTVRSEVRAALDRTPLPQGATALYVATVLAAAALSIVAVVLSPARSAAERAALLARLRAMGMAGGQRRRMAMLEALPPVLVATVAGTLLGLAAGPALGPALDLGALAGTGAPTGPAVHTWPLLAPAAALLVPAMAAVVLETVLTGRRGIAAELRAGEQ